MWCASVAPAARAAYSDCRRELYPALSEQGIEVIEETAVVLPALLAEAARIVTGRTDPLLHSSCPLVVELVTVEFSNLLCWLSPLASPMIVHARWLRQRYGTHTRVTFVGPCPAKRREAAGSAVKEVVLFTEVLSARGVGQGWLEPYTAPDWVRMAPATWTAAGATGVRELLSALAADPRPGAYELVMCERGCIGGEGMPAGSGEQARSRLLRCAQPPGMMPPLNLAREILYR